MKRVLVCVLVIVFALGLVGCRSISDRIGEEVGEELVGGAVGGDVEVDGDTVTIETEDGAVTIEGDTGKIPDGFPSDFPMYKGAQVDSTSSITSENDVTHYINLVSDADVKAVYDWYKAEFEAEGWEIQGDVMMSGSDGDTGMLTVEKNRSQGTVTMGAGDGGTEIGIILLVEG